MLLRPGEPAAGAGIPREPSAGIPGETWGPPAGRKTFFMLGVAGEGGLQNGHITDHFYVF